MSCARTGRATIKDLDESATRRQAPGNTETDDAGANDGDLWFANTQKAVGQEVAPFAGMTQTGSAGVISAAIIAAPLAVRTNDGDFRARLQALHRRLVSVRIGSEKSGYRKLFDAL
jgi:hypothetical protein